MTPYDVKRIVQHIEFLWRSRTPATAIDEQLAFARVGVSEIARWCEDQGIQFDRTDMTYYEARQVLFKRLKRKFPDDDWR